ncbi:MFS transporter [Aeromicrobium sp. P5_D10]
MTNNKKSAPPRGGGSPESLLDARPEESVGDDDGHEDRAAEPPGRDPKWWTLVAVCLGVFILLLDVTIVTVALADIQDDLHASLSDLQWVIDAYALSLAALVLTAGSLADLYGRRKVFVIGTALFMVGSIACGAAQDMLVLQLSRGVQGIGGAAMFATALALIASAFHGRDRGVAFGAFGATTGVAVALGPVVGGVLTSGISWRWIFFVNIPICLATIAITAWRVKESHDPRAGRPDWSGFVTFSLGLGALVYGLIHAGQTEWANPRVIMCLTAAVVLLAAFVVTQLRGSDPMFDLGLLRKPTFTGGLIAAFGVSASIFSLLTYLVIYVQNVLGYSAVGAGVRLLFLSGAAFVVATIAGRLTEKVPAKWLIAPGFVLLGIGLFLLSGIQVDSSWTYLIPGLLVCGVAIGMITTPLASTAVGVVAADRSGMASGINSTFRQLGTATGIAVLGTLFSHQVADNIRSGLAGTPAADRTDQIAGAVTGGQTDAAIQAAPAGMRDQLAQVATSSFVDALNHITTIAMALSFVVAACCFVLIREKDFVQSSGGPGTE